MAEKSVFAELQEKYTLKNKNKNISSEDKIINSYLFGEHDDHEPKDDIGERIEKEFLKRQGGLNNWEMDLAHKYFSDDYDKSRNCVAKYLAFAKTEIPEGEIHGLHMENALYFIIRASRDVELAMEICKGSEGLKPNMPYKYPIRALNNFKRAWYFISEFPYCFNEIMKADDLLIQAVEDEDYESAACIWDGIKMIIKNSEKQQHF